MYGDHLHASYQAACPSSRWLLRYHQSLIEQGDECLNPLQLRETTMDPNTRRLVQLTIDDNEATNEMMDMLLGKKRADDRRSWLQTNGDMAEV